MPHDEILNFNEPYLGRKYPGLEGDEFDRDNNELQCYPALTCYKQENKLEMKIGESRTIEKHVPRNRIVNFMSSNTKNGTAMLVSSFVLSTLVPPAGVP